MVVVDFTILLESGVHDTMTVHGFSGIGGVRNAWTNGTFWGLLNIPKRDPSPLVIELESISAMFSWTSWQDPIPLSPVGLGRRCTQEKFGYAWICPWHLCVLLTHAPSENVKARQTCPDPFWNYLVFVRQLPVHSIILHAERANMFSYRVSNIHDMIKKHEPPKWVWAKMLYPIV